MINGWYCASDLQLMSSVTAHKFLLSVKLLKHLREPPINRFNENNLQKPPINH